ncbi:hypothetical protein B566_EDAN002015 [Ephemera danica]|nr:hypothetical protein B566_EDAN002015 [Ephemera danica]
MEEASSEISLHGDVITMMDVDEENSLAASETNLVDTQDFQLDKHVSLQGPSPDQQDNIPNNHEVSTSNNKDEKKITTDLVQNTTSPNTSEGTLDENLSSNSTVTSLTSQENSEQVFVKNPVSQKEEGPENERCVEKMSERKTDTSLEEQEKTGDPSSTTDKSSAVLDAVVEHENPVNRDSSNVSASSNVVISKDIVEAGDAQQSEQKKAAQAILSNVESIESQINGCTDLNDDTYRSYCKEIDTLVEKLKHDYNNELIPLEKLNELKAKLQKAKENIDEKMKYEKEKSLQEKCAARYQARQLIERNKQNLEYIEKQVSLFIGNAESCGFRFLEDQLTNTMRRLDSVELKEETEIYQLYEASINEAQRVLNLLENRAKSAEEIPVPTADTCVQELQKIRSELNSTPDGTMNEAQNQFLLYRVHTSKSTFADLPEDSETSNKREIVARLVQECIEQLDLKLQKPQINLDNSETSQVYRQPLQLIIEDENGFRLDEDALRTVVCQENVKHRNLVVLSVVGEFRRGKSFLLNFMVRYLRAKGSPNWLEYESREKLEGFNWRRDKDRVTTGILIWPEAFIIGQHAVILLDTQGTFDMDSSMKQNTFIFALSTLISSIQILNIHQRFQLDAFMNLQYFIEFGRSVTEECEEKAFQKLLILVRDWKFADKNEYGLQGGQMYWSEQHSKQMELSHSVIDCFEDIECFLMPHPGEKVANGAEFKGALCDIDEIFVKNMKFFIENVFNPSNLVPKRVGPSVLNAEDLINTTKKFVENLQHSDLKPETLFKMTAEVNHEKNVSTAEEFYASHMLKNIDACSDISDIVQLNEDTKNRALSIYLQNKKLFGPKLKEKYVQILKTKLDAQYIRVVQPVLKERKRQRQAELERQLDKAIRSHKDALNTCLLGPEYHMFMHIDKRERAITKTSFESITGHVRPQGFLSTITASIASVITSRPSYRVQMSQMESNDMSTKFKEAADKTFQELHPRFKERTENQLTCVNNEAIEIYRTKMRESLNEPQSLQQFENIHNSAQKFASEHLKKRTSYLEIQAEVLSYAKKLSKWIEKTQNEFKQQNMEKFRLALETIKLDALTSYDQEMGTWIRDYKGPCDMKRFNENHNCTITRALDKFANSQFDKDDKIYKSVVDGTKKAIAEKMSRAKETFQAEGMQKSISLTLEKYTSIMESYGAKVRFVKDLKSSHDKAKEEALLYLTSLTDKSEKSEEAQSIASKHIKEVENDLLSKNDRKMQAERVKRIIGRRYHDPKVEKFKRNACFGIVNRDGFPKIEITKGAQKSCLSVEEVSAQVLREMKHQASRHLKYEVKDAVVTIPAYFTEPQRSATLEACRLADINVLRLLNEPTAAALAFGTEHKDEKLRRVLVFDFGGGTCDVSVLEIRGDDFVVKASRGDNDLGGQDIDQRLLEHILKSQQLSGRTLNGPDKSRILYECEKTKRILSSKMESEIILSNVAGVNLRITITRETFENINSDLFERAMKPVRDCLSAAKLTVSKIDEVVLAGGSSNIPKMKELLVKFFKGKKLHEGINPEEAIAHGAALQAAIIAKDPSLRTTITDITPHSLGIEVIGNVFSIITRKDSHIPCEHSGRYSTTVDFQKAIRITVYQGENSVAADANTLLGEFNLDDIRVAKEGEVSCDVTFKIDENGILHVTAKEVSDTKTNFKTIRSKCSMVARSCMKIEAAENNAALGAKLV